MNFDKNPQKIVNKKGAMQYNKKILRSSLDNINLNMQLKF